MVALLATVSVATAAGAAALSVLRFQHFHLFYTFLLLCLHLQTLVISIHQQQQQQNGFYSGRVTHTIVISQVVVQPNRIKIHSKIDEKLALCKYDGYITSQTPSAYRPYSTQWRF